MSVVHTLSTTEIVKIAARGLDRVSVPNWYKRVNKPIHMSSADRCVLGQIYGSDSRYCEPGFYNRESSRVLRELRRTHLMILDAFCPTGPLNAYALRRAWRREVNQRRQAARSASPVRACW